MTNHHYAAPPEMGRHSNQTEKSSIIVKRAETATQLAAQQAKLQIIEEQDPKRATLEREIKH